MERRTKRQSRKPGRNKGRSKEAPRWETKLTRVVETTDGERFETLHHARDFVLTQNAEMNEWTNAAGKLMQAAEGGLREDIEAATEALEHALFFAGCG